MTNKHKKLQKFWKKKKVFITGHTGFKGTWLVIFLKLLEAKIYGYSLKAPKFSLFNQTNCSKLLNKNFYSNINNFKNLKNSINKNNPDIIFHLAAQPLVSESYLKPRNTFYTNIIGTSNLIEVAKMTKSVKVIIIITTDKVYKIVKRSKPFIESDELGGKDPYSASKACAEIISNSYIESFLNKKNDMKISTARSGNVLGGGDYAKNRIIPDIIKALNNNQEMIIRNPNHIRPWQHVLEPLFGYLLLAEKLFLNKIDLNKLGYGWNFGPKAESFIPVSKLIEKIKKKKRFRKITLKKQIFNETKILKLNSTKSIKFLKWSQKWNIDETISKIFEWNEAFKNKKDMYEVCKNQIKEYLK